MASHNLITGEEFVRFVESHPDIWPKVLGTIVVHVDSGSGAIETVEERKKGGPLLGIRFSSTNSTDQYNLDAFKDGYVTDIQISAELLDSLNSWKGKKNPVKKQKGIVWCNHGPFAGPALLALHIKLAHGKDCTAQDFNLTYSEKKIQIPQGAKNLPELIFKTRSPEHLNVRGICNFCNGYSSNRWLYRNTTLGEATICGECRDTKLSYQDIYSVPGAIYPGNFGG